MKQNNNFKETMKKLKEIDEYLTHKLAICSSKTNKYPIFNYLRNILMLLEFSFHGIPWFLGVIYFLITENIAYGHVAKPMLTGKSFLI